ncbi:DinB family protein [Cohnella nanjingensis]|uniref:DinB family protein n=1 Tax=Cohnella nanjingensis TaxID=1387779 RepID=A0A7X0RQ09_9BACL|nr:DinB family protein [Cohnella nanjingensis]MBB6671592.1 DinB family protein [Cohnella nanjingensis]
MQIWFRHNWIVREQWYDWCEELSEEELLRQRTGGVGGILHTLFHVADVEWSWIRALQGKPDFQESFDGYRSLEKVKRLDRDFRPEVEQFVAAWNDGMEARVLREIRPDGSAAVFVWGEIMRHTIAHQIHHLGQLSIWAREIGKKPVSANVFGKGLIQPGDA